MHCFYTQNFHIKKEIQGITQDMQSAVTTMDGKYLLIVTAGFQRFASGVFVLVSQHSAALQRLLCPSILFGTGAVRC